MSSIRDKIEDVIGEYGERLEYGLTHTGTIALQDALVEAAEQAVKEMRKPERETLGFIRSTISDYDRDGMRELGFIAIQTLLKGVKK